MSFKIFKNTRCLWLNCQKSVDALLVGIGLNAQACSHQDGRSSRTGRQEGCAQGPCEGRCEARSEGRHPVSQDRAGQAAGGQKGSFENGRSQEAGG